MVSYITRRILYSIPVLVASSFISFVFVSLAGDPLELVRRAYAGWARRDFVPEEFWAEDLEWHASPDDPDTSATRGRAAVQAVLHDWLDHLGRYDVEFDFDGAEHEVLVCMRVLLEGAKIPIVAFFTCRVADGKINRVHAYSHRADALKAAGLDG